MLPESPRWLVVDGRLDEALSVIHVMYTNDQLPRGKPWLWLPLLLMQCLGNGFESAHLALVMHGMRFLVILQDWIGCLMYNGCCIGSQIQAGCLLANSLSTAMNLSVYLHLLLLLHYRLSCCARSGSSPVQQGV